MSPVFECLNKAFEDESWLVIAAKFKSKPFLGKDWIRIFRTCPALYDFD